MNPKLFHFLSRSIFGSFSSKMRQSACVPCSCQSLGWSLKIWQDTPPTWSVRQPSTLQGMGPAPCPPEGALSKQVSHAKSRRGQKDYSDPSKDQRDLSCSIVLFAVFGSIYLIPLYLSLIPPPLVICTLFNHIARWIHGFQSFWRVERYKRCFHIDSLCFYSFKTNNIKAFPPIQQETFSLNSLVLSCEM